MIWIQTVTTDKIALSSLPCVLTILPADHINATFIMADRICPCEIDGQGRCYSYMLNETQIQVPTHSQALHIFRVSSWVNESKRTLFYLDRNMTSSTTINCRDKNKDHQNNPFNFSTKSCIYFSKDARVNRRDINGFTKFASSNILIKLMKQMFTYIYKLSIKCITKLILLFEHW